MAYMQKTGIFDHFAGARRGFGRLVHEIAAGLEALHRVQFDEPWKPVRKPTYGEW